MTASEKRKEAVRLIKSIVKHNTYTQGSNRDYVFGKPAGAKTGYGDCSSTVRAVIKKAAGIEIGGNTDSQIVNAKKGKGVIVDKPTGVYFNEKNLLPGDALYFRGNTAHTNDVGHVEMYTGPNECIGHGSGTGPTVKNLKTYCASRTGSRRALCAVRWIQGDESPIVEGLGTRPLKIGDTGTDVKILQDLLIDWGYAGDRAAGTGNGKYKENTKAAVTAWQYDNGLPETGVIDADDFAMIEKLLQAGDDSDVDDDKPNRHVTMVSGNTAYIRAEPNAANGAILGVAYLGDVFIYAGKTIDTWHQIMYHDETAWITSNYTMLSDNPVTVTIPPVADKDVVIVDLDQHSNLKDPKNNWDKYCEAVHLTILRCGVTRTETNPIGIGKDDDFAYAAKKLNERNHPFGVYYYGKVKTADEARKEARKAFEIASPYNPLFYCYDVEEGRLTNACLQAFADELRKLGVKKVGLYVGHNYYKTYVNAVKYFDFVWIPRYGLNNGKYDPKYKPAYPCDIHQYTSVGKVPGNVDSTLDINRLNGSKSLSWFLTR